jgi:hypothetical protein
MKVRRSRSTERRTGPGTNQAARRRRRRLWLASPMAESDF